MATLTLKKSVNTGSVVSKKGDTVFVERKRTITMPGQNLLREAPKSPGSMRTAQDEKLRAVLAAAKAREEERRKKQQDEDDQRVERERQIATEQESYAAVKEKLTQKQNADAAEPDENFVRKFGVPNAPKKSFDAEEERQRENKKKKNKGLFQGPHFRPRHYN